MNPEKTKAAEDSEEKNVIAEQEISWNTVEQSIQTLIKFMKQFPSFSEQEATYAHVLHSVLIRKRQTCFT